ncbi:MAG: hypothetical protein Q9226_003906 [Calogaya cf. arnoldii]
MGHSIESSRPIMAPSVSSKRTSKRFSTYSSLMSSDSNTFPSAANTNTRSTTSNNTTSDARLEEIKGWSTGFDRLESKRLQQQRYQPTPEKSENLSKLALGAKVERALGRRMTDQDATFRTKVVSEKPATLHRSITTAS